jgi:hypothetical protein
MNPSEWPPLTKGNMTSSLVHVGLTTEEATRASALMMMAPTTLTAGKFTKNPSHDANKGRRTLYSIFAKHVSTNRRNNKSEKISKKSPLTMVPLLAGKGGNPNNATIMVSPPTQGISSKGDKEASEGGFSEGDNGVKIGGSTSGANNSTMVPLVPVIISQGRNTSGCSNGIGREAVKALATNSKFLVPASSSNSSGSNIGSNFSELTGNPNNSMAMVLMPPLAGNGETTIDPKMTCKQTCE